MKTKNTLNKIFGLNSATYEFCTSHIDIIIPSQALYDSFGRMSDFGIWFVYYTYENINRSTFTMKMLYPEIDRDIKYLAHYPDKNSNIIRKINYVYNTDIDGTDPMSIYHENLIYNPFYMEIQSSIHPDKNKRWFDLAGVSK